jgi:hydroxyacylglutathione hydrolase
VMHTPGHTPHHLSYVVRSDAHDATLFSGGSMLQGATGRTDLFDGAATEMLARAQWRSVHRMAESLSADTLLYPTHGFGSFCSAGPPQADADGTLREQWGRNPALVNGEQRFVGEQLRSLRPHPRYYSHMAPLNRQGQCPVYPARLRRVDLRQVLEPDHGSVVVDLRPRRSFAAAHVPGSINIEWGDSFAAYLGWSIPWGVPITLVAAEWAEIEAAANSLPRVGISECKAALYEPIAPTSNFRTADFSDLHQAICSGGPLKVLDARDRVEWDAGHLEGAELMPFYCIEGGASLLPQGTPIWVHCARGYRAAIAASLLERYGRCPVLIDDTFEHAIELGLASHLQRVRSSVH